MSIDATSSTDSILSSITNSYVSSTNDTDEAASNKEMFLTLLVAQLENQDPLNPTDSTEFSNQLTQYSILEQNITTNTILEQMSSQYSSQSAASLTDYIGKEIVTEDITGTVDAVQFESGQVYFVVGETLVDPSDVTAVCAPGTSDAAS